MNSREERDEARHNRTQMLQGLWNKELWASYLEKCEDTVDFKKKRMWHQYICC